LVCGKIKKGFIVVELVLQALWFYYRSMGLASPSSSHSVHVFQNVQEVVNQSKLLQCACIFTSLTAAAILGNHHAPKPQNKQA